MMPATRLTEPEQRELEWKSRWEQWKLESDARWEKWKLESQQSDDRWERNMQQLRNLIFTKPDGVAAMVDTESSVELHEKEDVTITELRSLERVSPIRDYLPLNPLPQVEGLGFDSLVSHDGGLDVHQTMATVDLDSGSRESHEEGEPQPISSTTLVQTDGSLGNQKEEMVNSTDLQSYKLSSYQKSTSYLAVEISDAELERILVSPWFIGKESDCVVFEFSDSQQLKKAESLPTARPNALVRELDVISPISAYYCVSLWMFIWYPKPMVKMKREVVALEVWSHDSLMARSIKLSSNHGCLVTNWFTMEVKQELHKEQMSYANFSASLAFKTMLISAFNSSNHPSLKWLSVWVTKPLVKMKFMAQHGEAIGVDLNSMSKSLCFWMPRAFGYYLKSLGGEGHVQWTSTKAGEDWVHAVILEELGWFIVGIYEGFYIADALKFLMSHLYNVMCDASHVIGNFHPSDVNIADQQDFGSKEGEGGLKLVKKVIMEREKHGSIVEEEATRSVKKALTISGNEFDSSNSFYQHLDVASFVKSSNLGEEMIENLGKQLNLDKRRLPRVMRGLCADECYGVFKFAEDAAILTLCGFSKPKKEPKATAASLFLMHSTFASEDLLHFETKELNVSLSPTASRHSVQQASQHFGNVEEMANKLDDLLEDIERLGWFLASSYASSSTYRSLKRLSVRFPRPMVKMKLTKYVGRS